MITELTTCIALGLFCLAADEEQKKPEERPTDASPADEGAQADIAKPELRNAETALTKLKLLPIERNIIALTNAERKKRGLPELSVDHKLMKSARRHCAWMTRTKNLVHTKAQVAENIAMGQQDSREAVQDWMTSRGHRANILNRRYKKIGAAAYRTPQGRIFWCQQFHF